MQDHVLQVGASSPRNQGKSSLESEPTVLKKIEPVQSPAASTARDTSSDSANPRRIGPSAKAGTSFSGATVRLAAFRGNSLRRSRRRPASLRNSAEKPKSSARSTPQNHSFSSFL